MTIEEKRKKIRRTCYRLLGVPHSTHWPLHLGGRGVIRSGRHLMAAAISSRNDVIRIVFSLLMSPSLVCWIGPTAVRKKVARVPLGRGLKRNNVYFNIFRKMFISSLQIVSARQAHCLTKEGFKTFQYNVQYITFCSAKQVWSVWAKQFLLELDKNFILNIF